MKQIAILALIFLASIASFPATAQTEELSEVKISATIRTYVLRSPRANAELLGTFNVGVEKSAYGRDAEGNWLRIMDGWVLAEVFNTEGEIGALPDTTNSFVGMTTEESKFYEGPSTRWFNEIGAIDKWVRVLVIGRNEDGSWFKSPQGWLDAATLTNVGNVTLLPVTPSGVIITAKTRTFILKEPDLSAEFIDVFEADQEALAIGRSGEWIQISQGWVSAEAVRVTSSVDTLAYTGVGIQLRLRDYDSIPVRTEPGSFESLRFANKEETESAIGRQIHKDNIWLRLQGGGWVFAKYWEADGDIMRLPSLDIPVKYKDGSGNSSRSETSSVRATATPRSATSSTTSSTWTTSTLRTLIARHTDDIRILDLQTTSAATTIEYDLKPWPFVPNESIANEVAFKIICAIRNGQPVPNTLKFIGHTHFKSEVGRKFTGPSVEMHISARNANRIVCRGNDPSDINWRTLASRYKSYPIPRGASIDYD